MAHKTSFIRRQRSKSCSKTSDEQTKMHENRKDAPNNDDTEIKDKFVDETDRVYNKLHVLKTRCYSEQNLILKTNTLRKLSATGSLPTPVGQQQQQQKATDCDKLNNNSINNAKNLAKSTESIKDKTDNEAKDGQIELNGFKKNSNVYNVFQAKTVLKERRRSLPTLPKLISQKLHEHNQKTLSKSVDNAETVAAATKEFRDKTFRTLSKGLGRLLKRHSSVNISEPDPVFKVAYLGNVLTGWAKGEGCVDKPLSTLWRNYNQSSKPDVVMKLSITNSGLKGITKEHGLTEYWAHRITFCTSPPEFPKIFCWVYRHEGRKLKHELRCHAVLCSKESVSKRIATDLQNKIHQALLEFKKDKIARQNARLSLANCIYDNPSLPRRKILLSVGGNNYKPPLERSKSAPKLTAIEEMVSEEDEEEETNASNANNKNTWTKDSTVPKMCCKAEDIFPSHTLGRRKCDHFRKISLPETKSLINDSIMHRYQSYNIDISDNEMTSLIEKSENVENMTVDNKNDSLVTGESEESDQSSSQKRSSSLTNHVSFTFSNISETSERCFIEEDSNMDDMGDNDVFYCESECPKIDEENVEQRPKEGEKSILEQLCNQANYLVLDSDEGSISSGCETASTVTSSDIEMTSLPVNIHQDYPEKIEKVSVLERVQSFEQLFLRERNNSMRSSLTSSCSKKLINPLTEVSKNMNDDSSLSPSDSMCYSSSGEASLPSCAEEVSLVPLGEKYSTFHNAKAAYMRCSTFPPDDAVSESISDADSAVHSVTDVTKGKDFSLTYEGEVDRGDSDSACSVESGYSELLENCNHQSDCLIGNTVMV